MLPCVNFPEYLIRRSQFSLSIPHNKLYTTWVRLLQPAMHISSLSPWLHGEGLEDRPVLDLFTTLHTSLHKVSSNHIQGMRLRKHSRKYPGPWFWVYNLMGEIPICTLHYTGTHTKMNSSEKAIKRMRVQRALRKTYLLYLGNNDRITFILFGKN